LDLVSVMARLRAASVWERLLIPAFVFFFAKLYPFQWVNNSSKSTAAAGGCVLVRREALERAGSLAKVAGELIDDCALAGLIKRCGSPEGGTIWLGLSQDVHSLRPYESLRGIWEMVTRTAFTQLRYSPIILLGTVLGMLILYGVPVLAVAGGLGAGSLDQRPALAWWLAAAGLLGWILMAGSFLPVLKWSRQSSLLGLLLPFAAALYTLMTIDSARRWWQGKGTDWKGRTYSGHP
jgi:hopene-associated glycosyltransferase HpnB